MTWTVELDDCTGTLLREIACSTFKRKDIASTYGLAILSSQETNWAAVNNAIIKRWSLSGLLWIKKQAWKRIEEKRESGNLPPDSPPG